MTMEATDHAELSAQFWERLETVGARPTLDWLKSVLAKQKPGVRSSNVILVAYTGCADAVEWIEQAVASPVTESWGTAAALLGTPWPRIAAWLATSGPLQLVGLDALWAYRAPAPNMSPLAQIAAPVLPLAPPLHILSTVLAETESRRSSPRVRRMADAIRERGSEILRAGPRGVEVGELPRLFLSPSEFATAPRVLAEFAAMPTAFGRSVDDMLLRLKAEPPDAGGKT